MGHINSRQINILRANTSGTWTTLDEYMNRKRVVRMPWKENQSFTLPTPVQFKLINSTTHIPSGLLGVLTATPPTTLITNNAVAAAMLPGAIGTASTISYADLLDNILNIVSLRYADTHNEIVVEVDGVDRTVFGLIQCTNGISEGTAIGAAGNENTQISFVYVDENSSLQLATIDSTAGIEFTINKIFIESQQPDVMFEGGRQEELVVEPSTGAPIIARYLVTNVFESGEVINIATGTGSGTGTSTREVIPTGSSISLPATEAEWNQNNKFKVRLNGVDLERNIDAEWESASSFSINYKMDAGDRFEIEVPTL